MTDSTSTPAERLAAVEALRDRWSAALDDGCPACGPVDWCDHAEGYHYALGDLWEVVGKGDPAEVTA
jgi:hypothetical protein